MKKKAKVCFILLWYCFCGFCRQWTHFGTLITHIFLFCICSMWTKYCCCCASFAAFCAFYNMHCPSSACALISTFCCGRTCAFVVACCAMVARHAHHWRRVLTWFERVAGMLSCPDAYSGNLKPSRVVGTRIVLRIVTMGGTPVPYRTNTLTYRNRRCEPVPHQTLILIAGCMQRARGGNSQA